jgi:DNA-binding cell septation regulator SpoVG
MESIEPDDDFVTAIQFISADDESVDSDDVTLLARVQLTFRNRLACKGLKIFRGEDGLWLAMPARRDNHGNYHDQFYPSNNQAKAHLEKVVFDHFLQSELYQQSIDPGFLTRLRHRLIRWLGGRPDRKP